MKEGLNNESLTDLNSEISGDSRVSLVAAEINGGRRRSTNPGSNPETDESESEGYVFIAISLLIFSILGFSVLLLKCMVSSSH